jgi:hypothetical protein
MAVSPGEYKGTPINPGTTEQIQAQMAAIDGAAPATTSPISASSLSQSPTPLKVPASTTPTGAASLQGQMEAFTANLKTTADSAKNKKDASGQMLADAMFGEQGETAITDALYSKEGGVDEVKQELDDINSQILQEQEGLRREIEALQDNPEGLTRSGVAGKIDEARRKSLRTQADLAVVQLAKQGRYDSAKTIADRAVAVQMEKQKQTLDTLKFIYAENKDEFSKVDQRAFETAYKERERLVQNEEYRLRAEFDQKIRHNDPMYQAQLQQARLQNQKIQQEIGTNYNMQMSQEEFDALPTVDKNNTTLLQLMGSGKVTAANKTAIGAGLALSRAAQDLAGANPTGEFEGLYPFRGVVDFFLPEGLKRQATVRNEAQINALNLQTQFWASGAALTEQQTEYVLGLIPTKNDTDRATKEKLNTLVNYMMTQTSAKLMTDGINFKPEQVNLFETNDLLSQASPEQLAELKSQGLVQ